MTSKRNNAIGTTGNVPDATAETQPETSQPSTGELHLTSVTDASGIDGAGGPDATVPVLEQKFDQGVGAKHSREEGYESDDDGDAQDSADGDDGRQNRRLTLLQGGVVHRPFRPNGVPVSKATAYPSAQFSPLSPGTRHEPPRLRYKAPPSGPPLWSAAAEWTDLTERRSVDTSLPVEGWTRDWTITYRHGKNVYDVPVANVSARDLIAADPIRQNSWHRNKTARAGLRYVHSTGQLHAHDSLFERKLLRAGDFSGATAISSQPFTLTWHDGIRTRHHTPDFLLDLDGQLTVINTRPAPLVKDTLLQDAQAIAAVSLSRGWDHALVVGYTLPAFTIIETVASHADSLDHLGYTDALLEALAEDGPTPFNELCRGFDSPVIARAVLQRLIWQREVSIDLACMLEDHSLVALPGEEVRP